MKAYYYVSVAVSLSCLWSCRSGEATGNSSLKPVELEEIAISGELAERISRNFDRLETPLYQPEQVFWTEEESGGWPADKEGRTILALVLDSRASGRTPVYLDTMMKILPTKLNEKGYLGTIHTPVVDEQQLSGHGWLLRGLCEYYEWKGDSTALNLARGIVENLFLPVDDAIDRYPVDSIARHKDVGDMSGSTQDTVNGWRLSSDVGCVFIGMEGLIQYYAHDRNPQIKQLIDKMIALYLGIDLTGVRAQTHASLTALRGILRYADITGDDSLIPEVESRWALYKERGMTENFENYNWFDRFDTWTEPCAVIDSYIVAMQLWQSTRNPEYLADADRIYYNGICMEQRANGGFGCDTPVGRKSDEIGIHADEAHWCCTMRGGEGLPRVAQYTWYTAGDTILAPVYHSNTLTLCEKNLKIREDSDYPFGDKVRFTFLNAPSSKEFVLSLVVPADVNVTGLTVNGMPTEIKPTEGFVHIKRIFEEGDSIVLTYEAEERKVSVGFDSSVYKIMRGPLVLSWPNDGDSKIPLYHLMDPEVSSQSGFSRCVLTKDKD